MGAKSSKNEVESITKSFLDVVTSVTQECTQPVNQSQVLNVRGNRGSIIDIGNIDWSQAVTLDLQCFTSAKTTNDITNAIDQQAQQLANTTTTALNFNIGSVESENVTRYITDLGTSISNAYKQNCSNAVSQAQLADITDNTGSVIRTGDLSWNQTASSIANCIQNVDTVNTAKNNLEQSIAQSATTKVNWLGIGGIIALIVIVLIIGVVIFLIVRSSQKTASQIITNPQTAETLRAVAPIAGAAVGGPAGAMLGSSIASAPVGRPLPPPPYSQSLPPPPYGQSLPPPPPYSRSFI